MKQNIIKNRMWLVTAIETFILGCLFVLISNFVDDIPRPSFDVLGMFDNPGFGIILIVIGAITFLIALCDIHIFYLRRIMVFLLTFVWSFYFVIFTIHDILGPHDMPEIITVFAFGMVLRLLVECLWGDRD